ncbi:hypothetical protein Leryth_007711 [Lithospermum erythrorhizon]|nr:hypothetical protein Leryth_007711 [Lithospermum erythrorhizon]
MISVLHLFFSTLVIAMQMITLRLLSKSGLEMWHSTTRVLHHSIRTATTTNIVTSTTLVTTRITVSTTIASLVASISSTHDC